MKFSLLYCLFLFLCISCGKGGAVAEEDHIVNDTSDDTYPLVVINTPTDNQALLSGSAINVTGTVSDNSLYQGSITIRNDNNGLIMEDRYYEVHFVPSVNFSLSYTASVSSPTDYTVTVKFEDHAHHQTVKTVTVKVNP